nr:PREDICTED: protein FAM114A2 [Megachile rotundata]XP_012149572.1 PREDICTED: protein FAM114A2 [Megachile rotundata]XP_012149573.1 PREDICTED: protein FAM114A2 [Megachile rotundata]XP_012149574.1 PREDICTED: protein FAM114A2 [Megachile rotundata]
MATSESDDFESADEEMNHNMPTKRIIQTQHWSSPTTIGSDSDDDTEYVPRPTYTNVGFSKKTEKYYERTDTMANVERLDKDISIRDMRNKAKKEKLISNTDKTLERVDGKVTSTSLSKVESTETAPGTMNVEVENRKKTTDTSETELPVKTNDNVGSSSGTIMSNLDSEPKGHRQQKLGAKKIGSKITVSDNINDISNEMSADKENVSTKAQDATLSEFLVKDELTELDMPEEMKSDKKFKEVFKPEGWEGLGNEIELPEELTEEKLQPIMKKLSLSGQETENSSKGWGWGGWDVTSLINTATAGVSTLTSHVTHGLTLLEESMAIPDEPTSPTSEKENSANDDVKEETPEEQSIFGFGNLISGMSSITKLVESTGSKVMSGGLDTLEAIGKKTMEVLQDGDPGLKKKRAFFMNEIDKPNLSQVLREAKEKAESVEKTVEEKQKLRKVHFESLFDDYQGLVHLEALEMLSKQSNIKIQQHLMGLNTNELNSMEETLEDVKELCDLGEDDENEDEEHDKDLKCRLQEACNDLGINISYEKLHDVSEASQAYTTPPVTYTAEEIHEHAISVLAQFTAFSVERFHKSAELLLIKEHRSTVNEADALVRLTHILSKQIGVLANTYCSSLNVIAETSDKADDINSNITTIFMEASNASSYIQDAFKLLVPIIQVGAI